MAAAAAPWDGGCWLVELFGDDASIDPAVVEPYLRLLVSEAVRGAQHDATPIRPEAQVSPVDG
jgi:hypothetical protein